MHKNAFHVFDNGDMRERLTFIVSAEGRDAGLSHWRLVIVHGGRQLQDGTITAPVDATAADIIDAAVSQAAAELRAPWDWRERRLLNRGAHEACARHAGDVMAAAG